MNERIEKVDERLNECVNMSMSKWKNERMNE
jgi:hypothetical protein